MDDTDKKLLEQAAAAAGDPVEGWTADAGFVPVAILRSGARWQPLLVNRLTDCMGDALRLAVKLGLSPEVHLDASQPLPWLRVVHRSRDARGVYSEHWQHVGPKDYGADPYAATRRAIVRAAAAAIGEAMP
jgi:hypothetical protein